MGVVYPALIANPDSQNGRLLDATRKTVVAESQTVVAESKVALHEVLDRSDEEPKEEVKFDIIKLFENLTVASNLRIIKPTYDSKVLERELEKANSTIKSQGHIIDNFEKKPNEETEGREAAEEELEDAKCTRNPVELAGAKDEIESLKCEIESLKRTNTGIAEKFDEQSAELLSVKAELQKEKYTAIEERIRIIDICEETLHKKTAQMDGELNRLRKELTKTKAERQELRKELYKVKGAAIEKSNSTIESQNDPDFCCESVLDLSDM